MVKNKPTNENTKSKDASEAEVVLEVAKFNAQKQIEKAAEIAKKMIEEARQEALEAANVTNHLIETARVEAIKVRDEARSYAQSQGQSQSQGQGRYLDLSRVPLICQSIIGIHGSLDEIKRSMSSSLEEFKKSNVTQDQFQPVKVIAYGLVSTIMLAVVGAILSVVLKN